MPAWFVLGGAIIAFAGIAVLIARNRQQIRNAERQLARDIEAWLHDRTKTA